MTLTDLRVKLYELELPLKHSFATSSHRKTHLTHIVVAITNADGITGWGEIASPTDPFYCAETLDTAWLIASKYLAQLLHGSSWQHPVEAESCWEKLRGHEFAKAGFSLALWDLYARSTNQSLAAALGGTRTEVVAGVSLGIENSIPELLEQVALQLEAGYPRIKLKIAPGWDLEPVRAVREKFGDIDLHVDANAVYVPEPANITLFKELDNYGLTMIEQPFAARDFLAHSTLQQQINTPVCLDESVVSLEDFATALHLDACRVLNIKVSRMGGLTIAKQAHDLALEHGIPVWCGGMHEFGIGRAANVAISALPGFTLPSDVSASAKYYRKDIISPEVVANAGRVAVPDGAGIGFVVLAADIQAAASRVYESGEGRA